MSLFVVTYKGQSDPSAQEEQSLVSAFNAVNTIKVVDRMPGTLLVEGEEADVALAVRQHAHWTFARESSLSPLPSRSQVRLHKDSDTELKLAQAAEFLAWADGLLITAGAGMGVDSGLPDFRGDQGFWRAYPALARAGRDFASIACPDTFEHEPYLAWGFYGHRLGLYRRTEPHAGFALLQQWAQRLPQGAFVFTSNVDGHFQKAGFAEDQVHECHGSIHHLQCTNFHCKDIWSAAEVEPAVDEENCQWVGALPRCPSCGSVSRPNILMFGDGSWQWERVDAQAARMEAWLKQVQRPVIVEMGAGLDIPTVRHFSEDMLKRRNGRLIRINPRDIKVPSSPHAVGIPLGSLKGLQGIDACWPR